MLWKLPAASPFQGSKEGVTWQVPDFHHPSSSIFRSNLMPQMTNPKHVAERSDPPRF